MTTGNTIHRLPQDPLPATGLFCSVSLIQKDGARNIWNSGTNSPECSEGKLQLPTSMSKNKTLVY